MTTGIDARLDRIGTDGRMVNVPMDHGITIGSTAGLKNIEETIDAVTRSGADSVLTQKGLARRVHPHKNGKGYIIHLNASTTLGPNTNDKRITGSVAEAVRLGADAVSLHLNIGSEFESRQVEQLANITQDATEYGMPVLAMTYARGPGMEEDNAEQASHAVRIAEEVGANVAKTGYTGDASSFRKVTSSTSLPVLMAGGDPQNDRAMLDNVRGAMDAGAAGVSMGRSIFQHDQPGAMTQAVSTIVHDDESVDKALERAEL
ncbi:fructose-bisphosphate aldolase [halophilic archaeon]|nr:fructose-bisphosphate aldolase [halophilic archaeon]